MKEFDDGRAQRLTFQEQMDITKLPTPAATGQNQGGGSEVRQYIGKRAAWRPGGEFAEAKIHGEGLPMARSHPAAFGGQVYSQSALAVCRAWREEEDRKGVKEEDRQSLHTIHGYFTSPGNPSRPFIYTVDVVTASRLFSTLSVIARQPSQPSNNPDGDHFPIEDANLPVNTPCYHAICSFKRQEPHSSGVDRQEDSVQKRFAHILARKKPQDWPPSPPVDVDGVVRIVGPDVVGKFPIVDMKKVDMTDYNRDKPVHERRELLLYRLLAPLPSDGTDGWDANAHVLVHAYEADRNGLLMLGNHVGFGEKFGRAASLSYSFVVHTSAQDAVMRFEEQDDNGGGWWVQEACFPRTGSGRGVVMSKIWSPSGLHIATEYQDGLCKGTIERGKI